MSMYTDLHNFTSTRPRSVRFHGIELRVQGKMYFLREKLGYKIDSYVCYHISATYTFFMHGSLMCWTWSTLPKLVANIPCKNSWTVSCMFTGNIYAPLPTGYLVDIFRKKHFVTFKVAAFLIAWSLLFFKCTYIATYLLCNWRFRNLNCYESMPFVCIYVLYVRFC